MAQVVNGAQVNETHARVSRSRSKFMLKQDVLDTFRFGEYHPHFVFDGVTSDKLIARSVHNARSYTLKAPLMQDVQMHKDYFYVPLRAILPLQADRIITNPTLGDDVPADSYTAVADFTTKVNAFAYTIKQNIKDSGDGGYNVNTSLTLIFKYSILLESVFSHGCLLASLGCTLNDCCTFQSASWFGDAYYHDVDQYIDLLMSKFLAVWQDSDLVVIDGKSYEIRTNPKRTNYAQITFRDFLQMIRDTSDWSFSVNNAAVYDNFVDSWVAQIAPAILINTGVSIDIARLWAYHLCQAEFYTNDKVDYIYSADLFRQYIGSLIRAPFAGSYLFENNTSFLWNGIKMTYDFLSSHFFDVLSAVNYSTTIAPAAVLQYFLTLFGYHRSLRFKDYFVGSRTRPLAVAGASPNNTDAPVVNNAVSVIDITRRIQVQRYLNAVNATGRKFEEYLKGIFGVAPSPDHHNPLLLAHVSDSIFSSDTENTGSDVYTDAGGLDFKTSQNSVTAVFRGNGNQYAFEFEVKEPCIILGVTSFDIERAYPTGIERSFFTKDRFDMFVPELQYVGDQMVYKAELSESAQNPMTAFGYQFRDMDRKQLINRAHGGFAARVLPGFAFMYDDRRLWPYMAQNISPAFIRSMNAELDQFYLSLTGFSLGTYFHFVIVTKNSIEASRPMAVNPQILG